MPEMLIKICGLSTPETVDAAVAAGATHVGLVHFPKSPRHVSATKAADLRARVPEHVKVVLLTVVVEDTPRVALDRRFEVDAYGDGFFRVLLHYGFTEEPDVPQALSLCHLDELDFSPMRTTYFLSRETVIPSKRLGMARWRETLFAFLLKNANSNLRFFKLPLNRVIELGTQVEI